MKHKKIFSIFSVILLTSCQDVREEKPLDSYRATLSFYNDSFNIMQLTDIHWNYTTDVKESKKYMLALLDNALLQEGHVDLVTITGDLFLDANKYLVEELFRFLSSWNLPIAITYGNHDKEGTWNTDWMNKMVSESKNFIAKIVDNDNVFGDTNYFIDIKDGNDVSWQIYMMDSNTLARKNGIKYQYDNIHEDQVEWMKRVANSNSTPVPSLGFIHIPPKELNNAIEEMDKDHSKHIMGEMNEANCATKLDSSFFSEAKNIGMKGIFFGHDHTNDLVVNYQDMILGYGVKSNPELYAYKDNLGMDHTGYALYSLKKDKSWSLKHVFMKYPKGDKIVESQTWESNL